MNHAQSSSPASHMWFAMEFSERLARLRKERGLTQKALAEASGVHATQIQRYESGAFEPTLDALRRLARALAVPADSLVFDADERAPSDDLKFVFDAVSRFQPDERALIKKMLQGLIIQHQTRQIAEAS